MMAQLSLAFADLMAPMVERHVWLQCPTCGHTWTVPPETVARSPHCHECGQVPPMHVAAVVTL